MTPRETYRDTKCRASRGDGTRCQNEGGSCHSFGVYAGFLCEEHAFNGFRDHCGMPCDCCSKPWTAADLDEPIEPEDY